MRATGSKVIVRQDDPKKKIGALFVPQGKEEYPNIGVVVSVGPKVQENVRVGDRVLFKRSPESALAGGWGREGDEFHGLIALPEDCIMAVLEDS